MVFKGKRTVSKKLIAAFAICIFIIGYFLFPNSTERLVLQHPIEMLAVDFRTPFAPEQNFHYEITPDLKVLWYEYDAYDWSDNAEIWAMYEKAISQKQYDNIIKAIATNDFISFPEELASWQGADGASEELAIIVDGTTYRSGGYNSSETDPRFSKIWDTLRAAAIFDYEAYTKLPSVSS